MEFLETKHQSNMVGARTKKVVSGLITWAMLAQSYLGYATARPVEIVKLVEIKNYGILPVFPENETSINNYKEPTTINFVEVDKTEEIPTVIKKKVNLKSKKATIKKRVVSNAPKNKVATITFTSTLAKGVIGTFKGRKLDNPADNIFNIGMNQVLSQTDKVWLEYDLNGLESATSVSKSINDRLATGGYLVKKNKGWTSQKELVDAKWLVKGDNKIQFSLPEKAKYGYEVRNVRLVIEKNAKAKKLIVNETHTLYNNKAYIKGFIKGATSQTEIFVDNKKVANDEGEFEAIVEVANPKPIEIRAVLPNGKELKEVLSFTENKQADYVFSKSNTQSVSKMFVKGIANQLQLKGAELEVNDKALKSVKNISITTLRDIDIPALDIGMSNTTKDFKGYRFLPHGEHFEKGALVKLAYDRTKIPSGYTENDIKTYYFDNSTHHWIALERDSIDKKKGLIISKTTHFTDMINGVIQTPESPESQGFAPTSMSDIKAADPTAKVQVVGAPSANQRGSATTGYSFEMPPARNGMAPSLGIQYNSDGGSGWLGEGWDLSTPSISVDTRWGVPRYSGAKESETYSFNGSMLAMLDDDKKPAVAHRGEQISRKSGRRFYPRNEGSFSEIVRNGDGFVSTTWTVTDKDTTWTVTDKKGTKYTYGGNNGILKGKALEVGSGEKTVIVKWYLSEVKELHGDWIKYYYEQVNDEQVKGSLTSHAVYLTKVEAGQAGKGKITEVLFTSTSEKDRKTSNARYGFLTSNHRLLDKVEVKFEGETLRSYGFEYETGAFSKKLLQKITQYNSKGEEFNHHELDYYNDVAYEANDKSYNTFGEVEQWTSKNDFDKELINPIGEFNGEPSLIGGSKSTNPIGVSFYGGIGLSPVPDVFTTGSTVGVSSSYSKQESKGLILLIDIDGDGLSDKVYKKGNKVYYRRNLSVSQDGGSFKSVEGSSPDNVINTRFSDYEIQISTLSKFSESSSTSSSSGAKIKIGLFGLGGTAGVDYQNSTSKTKVYFKDVNSDGLIDIVNKGTVYFNRLEEQPNSDTSTGAPEKILVPTFKATSAGTPSPINALGQTPVVDISETSANDEEIKKEQDQLIKNSPLHDVVRVWEAPFNGNIKIESSVRLMPPTEIYPDGYDLDDYDKADGVVVSIEKGGDSSPIWGKRSINRGDNQLYSINQNLTINKGDKIYFRVQSGLEDRTSNGAFDQVEWDPIISYIDKTIEPYTNNNENYKYQASKGEVLDINLISRAPEEALDVNIIGTFVKPVTSDDITLKVVQAPEEYIQSNPNSQDVIKNPNYTVTEVASRTFRWNEEYNGDLDLGYNFDSYNDKGSNYRFIIESNTNVEWNKVVWKPILEYTQLYDSNGDGVNDKEGVSSNSVTVDYTVLANHIIEGASYKVLEEDTNTLYIEPTLEFETPADANGEVVLSVKKAGTPKLLGKITLTYENGILTSDLIEPLKVEATQDDVVWVEYHSDDIVLINLIDSSKESFTIKEYLENQCSVKELSLDQSHVQSELFEAKIINSIAKIERPINIDYRAGESIHLNPGFHADSSSGGIFDARIEPCGDEYLNQTKDLVANVYTDYEEDKFGPMYRHWGQFIYNGANGRSKEVINEDELKLPGEGETEAKQEDFSIDNMVFFSMSPDAIDKEYWSGSDNLTYIDSQIMSSSRFGEDDVIYENPMAGLSDELKIENGLSCELSGTGLKAPTLVEKSTSSVAMAGLAIVTASTSIPHTVESKNLNSYEDMNGDGYPDLITKNKIQITNHNGIIDGSVTVTDVQGHQRSEGSSYNIGFGGGAIHGAITYSKGITYRNAAFNYVAAILSHSSTIAKAQKSYAEAEAAWDKAKNNVKVSPSIGSGENKDWNIHTWADVNGDGLPDKVNEDKWVQLNLGYRFSEAIDYGLTKTREGHRNDLSVGLGFDFGSSSISAGLGVNKQTTIGDFTLMDINSDGLVDQVTKNREKISVRLGLGDSFSEEWIEWTGLNNTDFSKSSSTGESVNAAYTIGICTPVGPTPFPCLKASFNFGVSTGQSISKTEVEIKDIDGDGFADYVASNDDQSITVRRSTIARTNKLKTVHNPLGGEYTIDYARSAATQNHPGGKWVMSSIEVNDGIHDDGANMKTGFRYGKGKYDRHERQFLGFGKVIAESLDSENNDTVYRRAVQEFDVSDYYKAGNLVTSYLEDAEGHKFTESTNEYYVYNVTDAGDDEYQFTVPTVVDESNNIKICSDRGIGFTPMKYAKSMAYEGKDEGIVLTESLYEYYTEDEEFGDLKSYYYSDKGNLSINDYNYKTEILYTTYNEDGHGEEKDKDGKDINVNYKSLRGSRRILGLPIQVKVIGRGGDLVRLTQSVYDDIDNDNYIGNLIQVRSKLNDTDWTQTDIKYNRYGNIIEKTLPENANGERMFYKYRYERDFDMYVERIDDAYEYRTEFENFDYRYGIPLLTRDYNDFEIHKTIDEYGRLITVTGPNELANGIDYTLQFKYNPIAEVDTESEENTITQPAYAITRHYDEEHSINGQNSNDLITVTLVDGTGRAIQVKKDGVVTDKDTPTTSAVGMIVSGRAKFDPYGRVAEAHYPSFEEFESGESTELISKFNPAFDGETPTKTVYDILDRAVETILPDGASTKMEYATDDSSLLITKVTDAENSSKASFTNGSGLTKKVEEYSGPEGTITTNYEYNPINELVKVIDVKGNEIISAYDLAGRRTSVTHPDAGTSTFKYDTSSNLVEKRTANNDTITYDYDYTRLVGVNYPRHPENNVKYHYGNKHANHNRIGRLVLQEDASGAQEFYYGRLGELEEVRRTLIVPNNAIATYVTKWRYDSWNRLQEMIYPDEEKITYSYNKGGLLDGVTGEKTFTYNYVNKIGYDKFEQRSYLKYCNGSETKYTYESDRRRLSNLKVMSGTGYDNASSNNEIMNNTYTYDQVSNVLGVVNSATASQSTVAVPITDPNTTGTTIGGGMNHAYAYDGLHRLKTANGTFTGGDGKTANYTLNMAYDNLHNITAKKQEVTQAGIVFDGSLASGYDLTYAYDEERPHQMASVNDKNYRTEGSEAQKVKDNTHKYQYDANGNMIYVNTDLVKEDGHTEDKIAERKLLWDEENRLESVSDNGFVSNYWYDASGERTIKTSGDGEGVFVQSTFAGGRTSTTDFTLYVNPYMVVRNGGTYTKHIYMGGQRIVSKLGDMDSYGEDPRRIEYAGAEAEAQNGQSVMPDYKAKYKLSYEVMKARYDSLEVPYRGTDNDDYQGGEGFCCTPEAEAVANRSSRTVDNNENPELLQYFYHADHLGSSSYITNLDGEVAQHIEYVPFGEVFIEERNNTWNTPYLFNGKELDEETGLYYYGARYYNPRVSQWLSVDPLWEANANRSPYEYTYSDPINFTDPSGMIGESDFKNKKTGEKRHIDDGVNQTVEVDDKDWDTVLRMESYSQLHGQTPIDYENFISQRKTIPNKGSSLPSFGTLENNYLKYGKDYPNGGVSNEQFGDIAGGKVELNIDSGVFINTCALRTSHSLTQSGEVIPRLSGAGNVVSNKNGNWYITRVKTLKQYLTNKYGQPNVISSDPNAFNNLKGIIIYDLPGAWGNAGGHATLWNGENRLGGNHQHSDYLQKGTNPRGLLWITK